MTTSFNRTSKGKVISKEIQQSSPSWKWWPHAGNLERRNGDLLPSNTSAPGLDDGLLILAENDNNKI